MHRPVRGNTFAALVAPILLYVFVHKLLNKRRASAHRNAENSNPGAPSPSMPQIRADYEVFLSFRGIDTRKSFTDYLHCGFINAGIRVFKDDDEFRAGEEIGSDLLEVIENSKILIPVISPSYASSKRCLDELVHMMKCNKRLGNIVLPIFYKVKSADVRRQIGGFGEVFPYCGRPFDERVVEEWKQALTEVASLRGWESEQVAYGHEGKLVKSVVREVLNELKKAMESVFSDYLVGMDSYVEEVMELVKRSSGATLYVGIYGMGGIGKTALVKTIYNKLSNLSEHRSFIADIGESCKRNGINYLQNQLISDILKKNIQLYDKDEGINFISSKFKDKKVLIVLDDVDMNNQLEALVGNPYWFAPGSRVFVTTRKEGLLDRAGVDIKYEHRELDGEQSLILFSRHAFRRDSPPCEFISLSRLVVSIMGGLPLNLEIVGSLLCGKRPSLWRDAIEKMQKVPQKAVREKLRISYEELEEDQRQIFLDIACFLIGSDARVASYMWDACGFCTRVGIEVLRSLSFINIGDNHEFKMQNQIRDLGREIVREENCEPHKRSRLWNKEEALKVLEGNKGTEKIQAICLGKGNSTRIANKDCSGYINEGSCIFTDKQFSNLPSLRFLHMSDVNLIEDNNKIFSRLKWLKWGNCCPTFEANNFHARELVILDLSGSLISDDWRGWSSIMIAENLKVLNLTGCRSLKSTLYLSAFKRLEILILRDCCELERINPCIGDLETLVSLDLSGCSCLKKLPRQIGKLEQLKELLLNQTMIQQIPSSIGSLKKLETLSVKDCESLHGLPNSIGHLVNLWCLSLSCCCQLKKIPNSIGKLKLLTQLDFTGCSHLEELPPKMGELEQLRELLLDQTMIREIPSFIGSLTKLEKLSAKDCELLVRLSDSIGRLVDLSTLDLSGCFELAALPDSIGFLVNLRCLSLIRCSRLREIPNSIGKLKLLTRLDLTGCSCLEKLPPQMGELEQLRELLLDQTMIREILSSIGFLTKLEKLSAINCELPFGLPDSISRLVNLSTLNLSGCFNLAALPDSIRFPVNLRCLTLSRCDQLREIPNSIGELKLLTRLDLSECLCLQELPPQMGDLERLKELILDLTMIQKIPSFIGSLTELEMLSAKDCKLLHELPDSIGCLVNLLTLNLSGCFKLAALPDSIGDLVNLRCLSLSHCDQLREIPSSIGKLKLLSQLDLTGCSHLEELPPKMGELERLRELLLGDTMIREIPSFIGSLTELEMLSDKDCKLLHELPDSIGCLVNLLTLNLSGCFKLAALPDSIGDLVNLRCLSLSRCDQLREIPNSIGELKLLTRLDLSECLCLQELPPQMGDLEQLKELILDLTMIQKIPSFIGSLTELEMLSAKDCKLLHELPDSIGCLVNLSTLNLSGCFKLAALPDSIGDLVNLQCLSLSRCNQLRKIPSSIGKLKLLTQLDLTGCSCLEKLPPRMGELKQLRELLLDQTMIRAIPSSIGSLMKLKMLSAKDCKLLLELPDSIGCLVNLHSLSLKNCHQLRKIPSSIRKLMLTKVNLSRMNLMELYESIGDLPNLQVLDIHHGPIEDSPDGIGRLKKL